MNYGVERPRPRRRTSALRGFDRPQGVSMQRIGISTARG
jgi:hypothetical protein